MTLNDSYGSRNTFNLCRADRYVVNGSGMRWSHAQRPAGKKHLFMSGRNRQVGGRMEGSENVRR